MNRREMFPVLAGAIVSPMFWRRSLPRREHLDARCSWCDRLAVKDRGDLVGWPEGGIYVYRRWARECACERHLGLLCTRERLFSSKREAVAYVSNRVGPSYAARCGLS